MQTEKGNLTPAKLPFAKCLSKCMSNLGLNGGFGQERGKDNVALLVLRRLKKYPYFPLRLVSK
jgi:hypothetical protein